ncbi:MAG: hypothetical protein K6D02_00600 [Lachnospiraceae bacterium]|nr:hypothetical protein [Lachnospiraceae bacterium]
MTRGMKRKIASLLVLTMIICGTLANVPREAFAADKKEYIKEVRVGQGLTEEEAQERLTNNGYKLVKGDDGEPVNLNEDAGSKSVFSDSPEEVYVYLGYETTTNPNEAITDLAVMNMNGRYSVEEYEAMIKKHMDTKIKPFIKKFIPAIKEYRENYKKSEKSTNYKKANMVRVILNHYKDDDTGDKGIGDLLLNETKYELGDEAYDKLSDSDKKKHADIVTILMQADVGTVSMIEKLLVKATDSSDDTWIDRFEKTSQEEFEDEYEEEFHEENSNGTKNQMYKAMDGEYQDDAKAILGVWDDFASIAEDYEAKKDEVTNDKEDLEEKVDYYSEEDIKEMSDEKKVKVFEKTEQNNKEIMEMNQEITAVTASEKLEEREYEDGTMREFFAQSADTFKGDNIRKLYPLVDSLSKGQIAGLEFVTVDELIAVGFNDIAKFDTSMEEYKNLKNISIYEGINRELFKSGNLVALTDDSIRLRASSRESLIGAFGKMDYNRTIYMITGGFLVGSIALITIGPFIAKWIAGNHMNNLMTKGLSYTSAFNTYNEIGSMVRTVGYVLAVAGALMSLFSLFIAGTELIEYYKSEFAPIPKYMVSKADITYINDKGEKEFYRNDDAYYEVVRCTRKEMYMSIKESLEGYNINKYYDEEWDKKEEDDDDKAVRKYLEKRKEELGDYADLNGTVGKEWLALYSVKTKNSTPILADSIIAKTGNASRELPDGYKTGIHMFGEVAAYNIQNDKLLYRNLDEIRVYFKQDESAFAKNTTDTNKSGASKTGSFVSKGSGVLYGTAGFASGAVITYVILFLARRKKEEKA